MDDRETVVAGASEDRSCTATPDLVPDTATLLDDLSCFIGRYVVVGEEEKQAIGLWIAHTHAFGAAEVTPYLAITSADKECGKTRLLECLNLLARSPQLSGKMSTAVLVRMADNGAPTLLLDEADAAFGADPSYSETLRGVLNSGYQLGGRYSVCEGGGEGEWKTRHYSTFCPKAIAGIGEHLPDTVASRSIRIRLRRKLPHEAVDKFRRRDAIEATGPFRERLEAWAMYWTPALREARPLLPQELGDRAADMWEALIAIADIAGPEWAERARKAAVVISTSDEHRASLGTTLLGDIRSVFAGERMATKDLLIALRNIDNAPWGASSREWGSEFTPYSLARLLAPFEIRPKTLRFGQKTFNGYQRAQFEDAWARFIPEWVNTPNDHNAGVEQVDDVDPPLRLGVPF